MDCNDLLFRIDEFSNRQMDWVDPDMLEHFEGCEVCRLKVIQWKKKKDALQTAPVPDVPDDLTDFIFEGVEREKYNRKVASVHWFGGSLALAATILLSLGIWFFVPISTQPNPQKEGVPFAKVDPSFRVALNRPEAISVHLVGDFNNWNTSKNPLYKDEKGTWIISLSVKPGYYQYQLVVDGKEWILDPENSIKIQDGFGGVNSGVYL